MRPDMGLVVFVLEHGLTFVAPELLGFKQVLDDSVDRLCDELLPTLRACFALFSPTGCAVVTDQLFAGDALLAPWRHNRCANWALKVFDVV